MNYSLDHLKGELSLEKKKNQSKYEWGVILSGILLVANVIICVIYWNTDHSYVNPLMGNSFNFDTPNISEFRLPVTSTAIENPNPEKAVSPEEKFLSVPAVAILKSHDFKKLDYLLEKGQISRPLFLYYYAQSATDLISKTGLSNNQTTTAKTELVKYLDELRDLPLTDIGFQVKPDLLYKMEKTAYGELVTVTSKTYAGGFETGASMNSAALFLTGNYFWSPIKFLTILVILFTGVVYLRVDQLVKVENNFDRIKKLRGGRSRA
ncbi:hypothetical protein BKE30_14120 [Alkanindiges hydrocarboniclasticus]|uniref:Uncharacterized protein n=1 Tax=Alkanindiges hydrocarboniclasticus TaxID=1907941 RepID=A0A1S8CRZ2_9GAMM|nr:hypothetical protein [Alkanindiges hydrocarboniclasticus]ONG37694.1 hypothetical protein BKE30_14120 [Alkanindiges hydrocarboniclasticus]